MSNDILTALFPKLPSTDFKSNYWPNKNPYIYHGDVNRLSSILHLEQKSSVQNVLAVKPPHMFAWWKTDKVNLIPIEYSAALALYQLGIFTLQIRKAENTFSDIDDLMQGLSSELSTPLNYR